MGGKIGSLIGLSVMIAGDHVRKVVLLTHSALCARGFRRERANPCRARGGSCRNRVPRAQRAARRGRERTRTPPPAQDAKTGWGPGLFEVRSERSRHTPEPSSAKWTASATRRSLRRPPAPCRGPAEAHVTRRRSHRRISYDRRGSPPRVRPGRRGRLRRWRRWRPRRSGINQR